MRRSVIGRRRAFAVLVLLLSVGGPSQPEAQSHAAAETIDARLAEHKRLAKRAFELGDYTGAITEYGHAYARRRDPRLLYNLGLSYWKRYGLMRGRTDLRRARDLFQRFLLIVVPGSKVYEADRERLKQAAALAREYLRAIDREKRALAIRKPPSKNVVQSVSLTHPPLKKTETVRPVGAWISYGLGAALGVTAMVTGALALSASGDTRRLIDTDPAAAGQRADSADALALATDVLLIGAVVSAAVGLVLHLWHD